MKFNLFTKKELERDFPFLAAVLTNSRGNSISPEEVSIKRIDGDFLDSVPTEYRWTGSVVDICRGTEIIFILDDGTVIRDAVDPDYTSGSNYAGEDTFSSRGETVLHAIEKHGVAEKLAFIVERRYGVHTTNHSSHGQNIVIRKPGKGFTIPGLIRAAYQAASDQVAAESDL